VSPRTAGKSINKKLIVVTSGKDND
jgi:hypothetical protein